MDTIIPLNTRVRISEDYGNRKYYTVHTGIVVSTLIKYSWGITHQIRLDSLDEVDQVMGSTAPSVNVQAKYLEVIGDESN